VPSSEGETQYGEAPSQPVLNPRSTPLSWSSVWPATICWYTRIM